MRSLRAINLAVMSIFILSGAAGLIHEVAWTRMLRLVMGNTTWSISTVLCVFMGGLAVGSYLAGRWINRQTNVLRAFAILEALIGLYCLILPGVVRRTAPVIQTFYDDATGTLPTIVRFGVAVVVLSLPATMMGATLPFVTSFFTRTGRFAGASAGVAYSANTFGAVVGVLSAGFWLLPNYGLSSTIVFGSLLNFTVCGLSLLVQIRTRKIQNSTAVTSVDEIPADATVLPAHHYGPAVTGLLLVGYGFSGAASLIYEITWTRTISLMIGSSVHAFTIMLSTFILGLALGSAICARVVDRLYDPLRTLGVVQLAIGFSALMITPLFQRLPLFTTRVISSVDHSFWLLRFSEFALIALLILLPTILIGTTFPLAIRIMDQRRDAVGESVGTVYGSNSLGSIFGSLTAGFVLIPLIGIQHSMLVAVGVNMTVGCLFLLKCHGIGRFTKPAIVTLFATLAITGIVTTKPWDPARMTFAPFVRAGSLPADRNKWDQYLTRTLNKHKIIFHKEGVAATVTVRRGRNGALTLLTNGRVEAASAGGESQQKLLAHLPLLLHKAPRNILQIGLASGLTLNAAAKHPVDTLDCVELSPGVVEATRLFDKFNDSVLNDSRVQLIMADGRNHLALSSRSYDVIISQPSDPAVAGVADLFTDEFFKLCRNRLNEHGLVCVWLKANTLEFEAFRSVIHTMGANFSNIQVWSATNYTEYLVVASRDVLQVDRDELISRMCDDAVKSDLKLIRCTSLPGLLSHLVMGNTVAREFSSGATLNTDDNGLLEFSAARNNHSEYRAALESILQLPGDDLAFLTGHTAALDELRVDVATASKAGRTRAMFTIANSLLESGRLNAAEYYCRQCLRLDPNFAVVLNNLAYILTIRDGRTPEHLAEAILLSEKACRLTDRKDPHFLDTLSIAYAASGRFAEAIAAGTDALAITDTSDKKQQQGLETGLRRRLQQFRKITKENG